MPTNEEIADLAYRLWNARGRPEGSADEDWVEAERQLHRAENADGARAAGSDAVDSSLKETFPASDPPASHLTDEPPSNAEDKWAAARNASPAAGSAKVKTGRK